MNESSLKAIYEASPSPSLILLPDYPHYTIVNANRAYCAATYSRACDLIDKGLFEAFPDNPNDPEANGVEKLRASLDLVVATKSSHIMDAQKYDIPISGTKDFELKYWKAENTPVLNERGEIDFIIHTVLDITEKIQSEEKRKKAENLIRASEAKYRAFFENSMDGILLTITDGQIIAANPAACEIFKMTEKEICDAGHFGIADLDDPRLNRLLEERRLKGKAMGEVTLMRKDGSRFPAEVSSSVFEDFSGEMKTSMIIRDITERKEKKGLEKAYKVERQRFFDLYSQAPSCMGILKGPDHVYELANPLYLQLIDKKDIIGKSVLEVLPELKDQGIFEILDTVYHTGKTFSANEMLVQFDLNGNGKLVDTYLNFIYQPHRDNQGKIDGILFFAIDVTEQVISRRKIELSEKRFKTLIQEGSDLISIVDKNQIYKYLSPAFTTILGIEYEELIETSPLDRIHKDDLERVSQTTACLLHEKRVQYSPFRYRVGHDEYRWLQTIATNLLDDPTIQGVLFNSNDISDQMNYIQAIEVQNKKLKEIAWIQSHLVRAPVVRILALIDLLKDSKNSDVRHELLGYIYESSRELDALIKDIVDKAQKIEL